MGTKPRRGSVVWLMVCTTSTNLHAMADSLQPQYIRGDKYFSAALRHVITFGGLSLREISKEVGRSGEEILHWTKDNCPKSYLPSPEFRKKILLLLQEMVRKRADDLLLTIESPPRYHKA